MTVAKHQEARCPVCGNNRRNGTCPQCDANTFVRGRRWRIGDRAGKRFERILPQRTFLDSLDGVWHNTNHRITIYIDSEEYTYRSIHLKSDRDTTHRFRLNSEDRERIVFFKDNLQISGRITPGGFLVLKHDKWIMAFLYMFEEEKLRTCPRCFAKSSMETVLCHDCEYEFENASF